MYDKQIHVIEAVTNPAPLPYRVHMTLLDIRIAVGGLTEFAAGNKARIVRPVPSGEANEFRVRLEDLLKDGDITAKVDMAPGDIVIIPEAFL